MNEAEEDAMDVALREEETRELVEPRKGLVADVVERRVVFLERGGR